MKKITINDSGYRDFISTYSNMFSIEQLVRLNASAETKSLMQQVAALNSNDRVQQLVELKLLNTF